MGREIRMVPPNWDHPISADNPGQEDHQPMIDQSFEQAAEEWLADFDRIRAGHLSDHERECYPRGVCEWAADNVAPDPAYYRPWRDGEATWFQLWETVSEGTPVSPPFATKAELIEYLAANGDFWDQERCHKPDWKYLWGGVPGVSGWGQEKAERFVNGPGWAPSMVVQDGNVMDGVSAVTANAHDHHGGR
jgi:hypothetical protein